MNLPSVWGEHEEAFIDPLLIRDGIVTSVMNEPEAWGDRLVTLGFKRMDTCWLRVGPLTPVEFSYLSPSINLVGLRPEQVIDYELDESPDRDMPFAVQDALLRLWQRRPSTLLMALSYEHNLNFKRGEAWSFVEAALEGGEGPEIDTLLGMTLTQMELDGAIDETVQLYADGIGWRSGRVELAKADRGSLIFKAGQTIAWADSEGVLQQGRTAQRICSNDIGGWVYKESPRWVGGYPVTAPQWVSRSQVQHLSAAYDWLPEHLVEPQQQEEPQMADGVSTAIPRVLSFSSEGVEALNWAASNCHQFPFTAAQTEKLFERFPVEVRDELAALEESLESLSRHYYGDMPINFVVIKQAPRGEYKSELMLALSIDPKSDLGIPAYKYLKQPVSVRDEDGGFTLVLPEAADALENERRAHQEEIRLEGERVAKDFNLDSPVLMDDALGKVRHLVDAGLASKFNSPESVLAAVSVQQGSVQSVLVRAPREQVSSYLDTGLTLEFDPRFNVGHVQPPSMKKHKIRVATVSDAVSAIDGYLMDGAVAEFELQSEELVYYRASCEWEKNKQSITMGADLPGVDTEEEPRPQDWHPTLEGAVQGYRALLDMSYDRLTPGGQMVVDTARLVLDRLHLREGFKEAMATTAAASDEKLTEYIKQEMSSQLKGKYEKISESLMGRFVPRVISEMRNKDVQGVVIHLGTSRSYIRLYSDDVPYSDLALTQSREATLSAAATDSKARSRIRATSVFVDTVAFSNPELCQKLLMSGDVFAADEGAPGSKAEGKHEDTGVVSGFAMKDIRGFDRNELLSKSALMNDQQKTKYLTRELIWPRRSFAELKEAGVDLRVAFTYDTLWKSLPKRPKSNAHNHVNAFIETVTGMRESVAPILEKYEAKVGSSSAELVDAFDKEIHEATQNVMSRSTLGNSVYKWRDRNVRGYGLDWGAFSGRMSRRFIKDRDELSWDDVIKKRAAPKTSTGSRVQKGEVVRQGPDYRKGMDTTGDDFLKTFMYSGIEFGNWTNQAERQKHLNFAYDSMLDFSRIMGWEPASLSLGGRLGLCIGSRGRGGSRAALAHFEPANMAINLTRMRGDGSLAHEYFHAVANHYGRLASGYHKDVNDLYGYEMRSKKAVEVPPTPDNGLRDDMRSSYYNLLVAIMRKPGPDGDVSNISTYTEPSDMLLSALKEDGDKDYWASPREMFARAMEVWFDDRMREQGERNDYLVRQGKGGELYPDLEHLNRIHHYASRWLDAIQFEVQQIDHPYLGKVDIKVLNTNLEARAPLSQRELIKFCHGELDQLFGQFKPNMLITDNLHKVGLYHLARDVIALHSQHSDKGTFYHEAWHACHEKLLSSAEQLSVDAFFGQGTPGSKMVVEAMEKAGVPLSIRNDALADAKEMAAYAFQLWTQGDLVFDSVDASSFNKVRSFADGTVEIGGLLDPAEINSLFKRFASGELAERKQASLIVSDVLVDEDWDSDDNLVWQVPEPFEDSDQEDDKGSYLSMG